MKPTVDYQRINNTLGKMSYYLSTHNNILISVSGGSDSDVIVHIVATYFREYLPKIHFVFSNTGLEYKATLNHLDDLEKKYEIKIERIKGVPVPIAVKKYGVPFVSKYASEMLSRLNKHNFKYENAEFQPLYNIYIHCKAALKWWCNEWGTKSRFNANWNKGLKEFLIDKKPTTLFSAKCCEVSKKAPLLDYVRMNHIDLSVTGERKAEGGVRAAHNSCFGRWHNIDKYMPLLYWDDETKDYYKQKENIQYSDCYEVYGLKRTGCVGCPFAKNRKEELKIMQEFEPTLYKACQYVFGESYRLTDEFYEHRR